jgi:hypothetical protein
MGNLDALDEFTPLRRQGDLFGPLVGKGPLPHHQFRPFQTIDHARDARWPDEQALAQIRQAKPDPAFLFGPLQVA